MKVSSSHQTVPSAKLTVCELENGPVEIVRFPIKHGGSFHSFFCMFTRPGKNHVPSGKLT